MKKLFYVSGTLLSTVGMLFNGCLLIIEPFNLWILTAFLCFSLSATLFATLWDNWAWQKDIDTHNATGKMKVRIMTDEEMIAEGISNQFNRFKK